MSTELGPEFKPARKSWAASLRDWSVGVVVIFTCALVCYNIIAQANFAKEKDVTAATHLAKQSNKTSASAVSTADQASATSAGAAADANEAKATANASMVEAAKAIADSKVTMTNAKKLKFQQDEIDKLYNLLGMVQKRIDAVQGEAETR